MAKRIEISQECSNKKAESGLNPIPLCFTSSFKLSASS